MNGATIDPFANRRRPPKINIIAIIGANQSFFLTFRKKNNSFISSIFYCLKLIFKTFPIRSYRFSIFPIGLSSMFF